jgi:BirA family transcriptional regulator, biotin operon repressor / biotin---[acetyl-CoA-carboxylase] ligase
MQEARFSFPLLHKQMTESTNDDAREWAVMGAEHGAVVWAEQQSRGRGRRGAAWICPAGEALAFSVILRPEFSRALWPRIALVCGLSVCKVLESYGLLAEVKWPNDVIVQNRKICGILVEASETAVIAGIGLNVNVKEFPDPLQSIATSILLELGRELDREQLLQDIHSSLMRHLRLVAEDFGSLLIDLRERCYLHGKRVRMICSGKEIHGEVCGIGAGGELLLERNGCIERIMQADEIRITS